MSGSRRLVALLLVAAAGAAGCRHAATVAELPEGWAELAERTPPFQALYRLDCCGRRNMVVSLRAGDGAVLVGVAVPPGGVALEVWSAPADSAMLDRRAGCRLPLPPGVLPLASGQLLPIPPQVLAGVLSGRLPVDARSLERRPGWVAWQGDAVWLQALVTGPPPRIALVELRRPGERSTTVGFQVLSHQGRLPARCVVQAEGERMTLTLQSWRTAAPPAPPDWLSAPLCREAP